MVPGRGVKHIVYMLFKSTDSEIIELFIAFLTSDLESPWITCLGPNLISRGKISSHGSLTSTVLRSLAMPATPIFCSPNVQSSFTIPQHLGTMLVPAQVILSTLNSVCPVLLLVSCAHPQSMVLQEGNNRGGYRLCCENSQLDDCIQKHLKDEIATIHKTLGYDSVDDQDAWTKSKSDEVRRL